MSFIESRQFYLYSVSPFAAIKEVYTISGELTLSYLPICLPSEKGSTFEEMHLLPKKAFMPFRVDPFSQVLRLQEQSSEIRYVASVVKIDENLQ